MMILRRRESNHINFVKEAEGILKDIKLSTKTNFQALTRISIWNSVFPDNRIIPETNIRDHFNNILRRHLIGLSSSHRFLFELAVFFIDLPKLFLRILDFLPLPYGIAGRHAFRAVIDSIEPNHPDSQKIFIEKCMEKISNPLAILHESNKLLKEDLNGSDKFVQKMYEELSKIDFLLFESYISCLYPPERMRYSILYGCVPPRILLDLSNISMPFEFLQAIADIDGINAAKSIIKNDPSFEEFVNQ